MPGYLLTMNAVMMCTHGGQGKFAAPNPRVKIMGTPVPMIAPPVVITGCANPPPPANVGPCVTSTWIPPTGTVRVKSNKMPLVVQTTQSVTVPTPAPLQIVNPGQMKVKAM
jgi:hypothetical protein